MALVDNLVLAFEQIAVDINSVAFDITTIQSKMGDLATLDTSDKTSLVNAINTLVTRLSALELDSITLAQVNSLISTAKSEILGGAPSAYNTLGKIGTELDAVKSRIAAAEAAITSTATNVTALQTATAALGANKADKSALAVTDAALAALQSSLSGIINDSLSTATDKTYSIDKILAVVASAQAQVKQDLLGGAGAAYDTLQELKAFIDTNGTAIEAINAVVASHVSFADVQSLTDAQKLRARTNIGAAAKAEFDQLLADLGDLTKNFRAAYLAKRATGLKVMA